VTRCDHPTDFVEREARRRAVAWKADVHLDQIARHLEQEYEFDGGYAEMRREFS
jgi:hypothetical protein